MLSSSVSAQSLSIASAADLAPIEAPLRHAFPNTHLRFTFGSSGMLARQIDNGAPYDVYLSANEELVNTLARSGKLLPDSVRLYATGRLGLWSASGRIRTLRDLLNPGIYHIAIANPRHAPYGAAAEQTLRKSGVWERLQPRLVLGENVRQAYEYARTGNADAVITAWSLILDKGGILLPDSDHAPLRQAGGVVRGTNRERAARAFMEFLISPRGQAVFQRYGFFPPGPPAVKR